MLYFHTSQLKKDKDAGTILWDSYKLNEVMGVEFGWGVDLEQGWEVGGGWEGSRGPRGQPFGPTHTINPPTAFTLYNLYSDD